MSERFCDGDTNIRAILFTEEQEVRVGVNDVTEIRVVTEPGQMARVHWFAVFEGEKMVQKFNGALVEGVVYL